VTWRLRHIRQKDDESVGRRFRFTKQHHQSQKRLRRTALAALSYLLASLRLKPCLAESLVRMYRVSRKCRLDEVDLSSILELYNTSCREEAHRCVRLFLLQTNTHQNLWSKLWFVWVNWWALAVWCWRPAFKESVSYPARPCVNPACGADICSAMNKAEVTVLLCQTRLVMSEVSIDSILCSKRFEFRYCLVQKRLVMEIPITISSLQQWARQLTNKILKSIKHEDWMSNTDWYIHSKKIRKKSPRFRDSDNRHTIFHPNVIFKTRKSCYTLGLTKTCWMLWWGESCLYMCTGYIFAWHVQDTPGDRREFDTTVSGAHYGQTSEPTGCRQPG
jgi:hypothetical protein